MALWAKHLLCKLEEVSSNPQHPAEKPGVHVTPALWEMETSLWLAGSSVSEGPCIKGIKRTVIEKGFQRPPLASASHFTGLQMHTTYSFIRGEGGINWTVENTFLVTAVEFSYWSVSCWCSQSHKYLATSDWLAPVLFFSNIGLSKKSLNSSFMDVFMPSLIRAAGEAAWLCPLQDASHLCCPLH